MAAPGEILLDQLGITVAEPSLLTQALVHGSYTPEHGAPSNQRLEFLGDAVLDLAVADVLFRSCPDLDEGGLSKARISVVNEGVLADVARSVGLGDHLLLGKGAEAEGARTKPSVLSDALEAVIGAVYLSDGLGAATALVESLMGDRIVAAAKSPGAENFKGMLNEWAQATHGQSITFTTDHEGPSHDPVFTAEVLLGDTVLATGTGRSKKSAEIDAAKAAWGMVQDA
jgi:ribonuclease-3